jgi:hypothetical protein
VGWTTNSETTAVMTNTSMKVPMNSATYAAGPRSWGTGKPPVVLTKGAVKLPAQAVGN